MDGKNKGEKMARKTKEKKMAIQVSNAVQLNSKRFFPAKNLLKGNNLKVIIYSIITHYQNYNNQTVTSKEFFTDCR